MSEEIDYQGIITQLQLENEMLRRSMGAFTEVRQAVYSVPQLLTELWRKATSNKYQLLIAVMIVYWLVAAALMIYDRFFV